MPLLNVNISGILNNKSKHQNRNYVEEIPLVVTVAVGVGTAIQVHKEEQYNAYNFSIDTV
jgi:hypothetical protein